MNRRAQKKVEHTIRLVFGANLDSGESRRDFKGDDDCKRLLDNSRDETQAAGDFAEDIVQVGSGFSMSKAVLYKTDFLAVLRRRMTTGLSQNVFLSLQNVPKYFEHSVPALYGQDIQKRVRKWVMKLVGKDVRCDSESNVFAKIARWPDTDLLRQDGDVLEVQCACCLSGWRSVVEHCGEKRKYVAAHAHTLLGSLLVEAAKLRERDGYQDVD